MTHVARKLFFVSLVLASLVGLCASSLSGADPKNIAILTDHVAQVNSLAFSPDGKTLASGSRDKTVILWDVGIGKPRHTISVEQAVYSVAFSPDGKTLASGGQKAVKVWDVAEGKLTATMEGKPIWALSVAFSPNGKSLASGNWEKTIRFWNPVTGKATSELEVADPVTCICFSPDGKTLASNGDIGIHVWDVPSGKSTGILQTERAHEVVTFSSDGKMLASAGAKFNGDVLIWDVATGRSIDHFGAGRIAAFSSDGKTLATDTKSPPNTNNNAVQLWDWPNHKRLDTLGGQSAQITCLTFSPDGKLLAWGSADNTIQIWRIAE